MRILQVIHQFPPFSSQGSEVYCYELSKYLGTTDQVAVFHISNTQPVRPHRLVRGTYNGINTFHCIDGAEYSRMADWPNSFLRKKFLEVLQEFKPEIVHFHNYLSLADNLMTVSKDFGASVVYTLHDFGLICPNNILLRSDGKLCSKQHGEFFQDCCPAHFRISGGKKPLLASQLPSLVRWRMFANQYSQPVIRVLLKFAVSIAERWFGLPEKTDVSQKKEFYLRQTRKIFNDVDLFLAPSEFLRQRYISCGLQASKVQFLRYGMRRFERLEHKVGNGKIRFGYIGAFHAHKGLEVLLQAFQGLGNHAELHIYGSAFGSPISENHWKRISQEFQSGIFFHGRYDNQRIGEILSGLDAVVVPSVWFENSPLTIQEAFIAGVPVITSNQGGMAELVKDGVDGLHFQLGNAEDLKQKLIKLIEEPEQLQLLRSNIPEVPFIEHQSSMVRNYYVKILAEKK